MARGGSTRSRRRPSALVSAAAPAEAPATAPEEPEEVLPELPAECWEHVFSFLLVIFRRPRASVWGQGSSSLVGLPRLCRGALGLAASAAWAGLLRASLRVLAAQSGGAAGSRHAPLLHSGQIERRSGCFFL